MKRILIVEDDLVVSNIYRRKYEVSGLDVEVALDGIAGLEKVATFKPDLVQIDLQLPKMDGVELIKRIRARPDCKTLPIIVLSSLYKPDSAKEAWKAGTTKCISKMECNPNLCLQIIQQLIAEAESKVPETKPLQPEVSRAAPIPDQPAEGAGMDIRLEFLSRLPEMQEALQGRVTALIKGASGPAQQELFARFQETLHSVSGLAGVTGFNRVSHFAAAIEELVKDLQSKPSRITPSALRTLAQAADALINLCKTASEEDDGVPQTGLILAVDDDPVSRRVLCNTLSKAKLKIISLGDPMLALHVLNENHFDLIFLDADMPGMSGFELCKRLRLLPHNKTTPVVFVTSLTDFETRAKSSVSGGNDLIAKPYLLMEVAVKALTLLLKYRHLSPQKSDSKKQPPSN